LSECEKQQDKSYGNREDSEADTLVVVQREPV